jgi:sec-independent protein translocase protein TatA
MAQVTKDTMIGELLQIDQDIAPILFGIGMQEVIVIALIVLLLFGGKKIPELMKGLGKGVKSFKDGMKEIEDDDKDDDKSSSEK